MEKEQTTQQLTEQIAQLQQQLEEIKKNTAPKPLRPRDFSGWKMAGIGIGSLAAVILCFYIWACSWPLDNEDEVYKAGKEAHEAYQELNSYYAFRGIAVVSKCDAGCPICHPFTWRWHVRQLRHEVP